MLHHVLKSQLSDINAIDQKNGWSDVTCSAQPRWPLEKGANDLPRRERNVRERGELELVMKVMGVMALMNSVRMPRKRRRYTTLYWAAGSL